MFEDVHCNAGHAKTEHKEFQNVPEILEVLALLFLNFLDTTDEEENGEHAVDHLEEYNNNGKASNITLKSEYLQEITYLHA